MCGIVGYIGEQNCIPLLIEGLKRLEYRGYDSAGIGFIDGNKEPINIKVKGKVADLEAAFNGNGHVATLGIGHTRWATHGIPNQINAHPHSNKEGTLLLIHNGIIENFGVLKKALMKDGYEFYTETDTEVLVNLIDKNVKERGDLFQGVRFALNEVEGTYGICAFHKDYPNQIIAAKNGSPLVIGIGDNENFIASDVNALIAHTSKVVYLEDHEMAVVTKDGFKAKTIFDEKIKKEIQEVKLTLEEISKGGYEHFMLKEIMEQPESLRNSLRGRLLEEDGISKLGGLSGYIDRIALSRRIIITACGTSWHAGLVGEYMLEQYTNIPVEVEYASEFRYRNPILSSDEEEGSVNNWPGKCCRKFNSKGN